MLLESIIPALLPVATDGVRGLLNRFTKGQGAKPANVDEVVALMSAETQRLEALAKIDTAQGVSPWVSNVRAMQRPVASFLIISAYLIAATTSSDLEFVNSLGVYAQMVTFYLFGDRTYMYMKKGN